MKKGVIICLLLVFLVPVLFACQSASMTSSPAPETNSTATTASTIVLKYASGFPENVYMCKVDAQILDKIEKETNGRVKFERYYAGTLIPTLTMVVEISKGTADLGQAILMPTVPGFDVMKVLGLTLPGVKSAQIMGKIRNEVNAAYPEFSTTEWTKWGKVLATSSVDGYNLALKKPIEKLADLKGFSLRTAPAHPDYFKRLGVDPVDLRVDEVYMALQKGTIDGAELGFEQLLTMKYAEVIKYVTKLNFQDPCGIVRLFNKDSWNKLPSDIQQIILNTSANWGELVDAEVAKSSQAGWDYAMSKGVKEIELKSEDIDAFYKMVDEMVFTKLAKLDAPGMRATEIYKMFRSLAAKYQ